MRKYQNKGSYKEETIMASKFMRIKKLVIPVMAAIILTSQLAGCSSVPSNVMLDMLNQGQDIEITLSVPDYEVTTVGEFQALEDIQLDQLQTYMEGNFRADFDTLFGVKPIELSNFNSKSGCIYVDKSGIQEGNTSFMDSLRNKVFMETYLGTSAVQDKLASLAEVAYTDVEAEDAEAYLASLNAYYNLLSDGQKSDDEYFNATQSLSRGDFYSFVYRATNPVNNLLKTQGDFKTKVATNEKSALYASQVDQYAWLNADNDGLRAGNYTSSISRAEAVYMLINQYFNDELKAIDVSTIKLDDAKDGGDFLEDSIESKKESDQLYSVDKKSKDKTMAKGWELGVISKMLKASDDSVQTDLYKALGVAESLGIIDSETRFNEPLSKAEAIELMIKVGEALNERDGYNTEVALGDASIFIFKSDEEILGIEGESNLDKNGEVITEVEGKTPGGMVDQNNDNNTSSSQGGTSSGNGGTSSKPGTPDTSKPTTPDTSKPSGGNSSSGNTSKPTPPSPPSSGGDFGGNISEEDILNWGSDNTDGGDADNLQQGFDPVQ